MALKKIISMSLVVLMVAHVHGVSSDVTDYDSSSSARLQDKLARAPLADHRNLIEQEVHNIKKQSKLSVYQLDTLGVCLRNNKHNNPSIAVAQDATTILQRLFQSEAHQSLYPFGLNIVTLLIQQGQLLEDKASQKLIYALGKLAFEQEQKYPHHFGSNKLVDSVYAFQMEEFETAMDQLKKCMS